MSRHEVVVVGAGPAGLVTAAELGHAGVDVLVLDRLATGSALPRATVASMRTMELVRSWGLEAAVRAGADDVEMTMLELPTAARAGEGTPIAVGYPTLAQSALVSPTAPACVPQDHVEAVLLDHLATLPSVTVERGVEVRDLSARGDGTWVLDCVVGERLRVVEAAYVVGADGARSVVRSALGVVMRGPADLMAGNTTQFRAPVWQHLGEHRHLIYVTTEPGAEGVLIPAGRGDRWLFGGIGPNDTVGLDRAGLTACIRRAVGVADLPVQIERVGEWSSGAQLADRFAVGRCFLVGDAAHRVTPRGGTGLNLAIADAADLGWRLAWVIQGWAPDALLEGYEHERRPAVQHNVERSTDEWGSRREATSEFWVDLGARIRHVWTGNGSVSTLDLVGPGLTLFAEQGGRAWEDAAASTGNRASTGSRVPVRFVALEPVVARALGAAGDSALLVRPDGVPAASWSSARDAAAALATAVQDAMAPPTRRTRQAA